MHFFLSIYSFICCMHVLSMIQMPQSIVQVHMHIVTKHMYIHFADMQISNVKFCY